MTDSADQENIDSLPGDYQAFRIDPQARPINGLLDLCLRSGDHRAIAYNHLYAIDFTPSVGLTMTFTEHIVRIEGRRLHELYRYLKRHRVAWIWEALEQEERLASETDPVITKIAIDSRFENPA